MFLPRVKLTSERPRLISWRRDLAEGWKSLCPAPVFRFLVLSVPCVFFSPPSPLSSFLFQVIQGIFLCKRHLGHVFWSLHLSLSLCTTSDSRPGLEGSRTAASCRRQARRPSAMPLYHSAGFLSNPGETLVRPEWQSPFWFGPRRARHGSSRSECRCRP